MGTFLGHILPGLALFIYGLHLIIKSLRLYFTTRQRNSRFTSSASFPCNCLCGKLKELPMEGYIKIFFTLVMITAEIVTGHKDGQIVILSNLQHSSMYAFFGLNGLIDVLAHYKVSLPPDMDYASSALAFIIEAVLFKFHVRGRTILDMTVHTFLLYTIYATVIALVMEMKFRNNVLGPLTRGYTIMLQGSWFTQLAFILYNPVGEGLIWDDSNDNYTLAAVTFAWHCGGNFIAVLIICALISLYYRRHGGISQDDGLSMKRLIHTGANGQTLVALNNDSDLDSDIEFQRPLSLSMNTAD